MTTTSSSLKPSKKGRKRQLTVSESSLIEGEGGEGETSGPLLPPPPSQEEQHLTFQLGQHQAGLASLPQAAHQQSVRQSSPSYLSPPQSQDMQPAGAQWHHHHQEQEPGSV